MSIKIKNENYYSVEELQKILKLSKDFVLYDIKCGKLKAEYYVSESDLQNYKEAETKRSETKARLEARAQALGKAFNEKNTGIVENDSFTGQAKKKGNFRTWKL